MHLHFTLEKVKIILDKLKLFNYLFFQLFPVFHIILDSNEKIIDTLEGNNTFYPSFNMASIRAGIKSSPIEDLYIIPSDFIDNDKMKLIISINPLVWWMWLGGPIFILGTLISLWPRNYNKS